MGVIYLKMKYVLYEILVLNLIKMICNKSVNHVMCLFETGLVAKTPEIWMM